MDPYRRGSTPHLSGVSADGDRLTIRLRHPVSDLDERLASPYFCAVPKGTPAIRTGVQEPIPSAGPYYVAGAGGGAFVVVRRNPHFPRPAQGGFAAFLYTFNVEERRAIDLIRRGRADYAAFYGGTSLSTAQLRAAAKAASVAVRISPRPRGTGASIVELFGRRLGCRSYSPLYAGVELKRLCRTS